MTAAGTFRRQAPCDCSGIGSLPLSGENFSLSHTYATAGTYTVTVRISDDDVTSSRTATITVITPAQGVENAIVLVNQLVAAGLITNGNGNSLNAKLNAAIGSLEQGQTGAAQGQLNAALNEIDAMIRTGKLSPADAAALRSLVTRVLASIE